MRWDIEDPEVCDGEQEMLSLDGYEDDEACICGEDDCASCEDFGIDDGLGFWWNVG